MIVRCETCESRFRLDEGLVKERGTKVRCSQCGSVFRVFPPGSAGIEDSEETIVLDALPESEAPGETPAETPVEDEAVDSAHGREYPDLGEAEPVAEKDAEDEAWESFLEEEIPEENEEDEAENKALSGAGGEEQGLIIDESEADDEAESRSEADSASGPKTRRRSIFLPVFLTILVVVLAAFAILYYVTPNLLPGPLSFLRPETEKGVIDQGVRRLSFKDVKGTFLSTEDKAQRFVISGEVVNNYPDPRRFILVQAAILDSMEKVVASKKAYAGNPLSEELLRNGSMNELEEMMNTKKGQAGTNEEVPPGGSIPFAVVFEDLPKDVSEFTVEAVSSEPAGG